MKYLTFLLCLISTTLSAQSVQDKSFLKEVLQSDSIVYRDSIFKGTLKELREAFIKNKSGVFYKVPADSVVVSNKYGEKILVSRRYAFTKYRPGIDLAEGRPLKDSLVLSANEKVVIEVALDRMSNHKWPQGLFEKGLLVPADTMAKVFKPGARDRWWYFHKKGINKIYTLTPPIFFRNNTYCLFYYDYGCGDLCGWGEFDIYKKEQGKWIKYTTLFSWIS